MTEGAIAASNRQTKERSPAEDLAEEERKMDREIERLEAEEEDGHCPVCGEGSSI